MRDSAIPIEYKRLANIGAGMYKQGNRKGITMTHIAKTPTYTKALATFVELACRVNPDSVPANWSVTRISSTRFSLAYNGEGIGETFTGDNAVKAIKAEIKMLKLKNGYYNKQGQWVF
jgi:hypothetical protein